MQEDAWPTHAALDGQVFCARDGRADSDKVTEARTGALGLEADRLERRDELVLAELVAAVGCGQLFVRSASRSDHSPVNGFPRARHEELESRAVHRRLDQFRVCVHVCGQFSRVLPPSS